MTDESADRMPYALVAKLMILLIPAGLLVGNLTTMPAGLSGLALGFIAGAIYDAANRLADRMLVRQGYKSASDSRKTVVSPVINAVVFAGAGVLALYWKSTPLAGFLLACLILEAVAFPPQRNALK